MDAAKQQMRPKGADGFSSSDLSAEVGIRKAHPITGKAHNRDCPRVYPYACPLLSPCGLGVCAAAAHPQNHL